MVIKRLFNVFFLPIAIILVMLSNVVLAYATSVTASPTNSKVLVDGVIVAFNAYNINNENYFKLRDLAFSLNSTGKQFSIEYDSTKDAIILTSGKSYTPVGGEMDKKLTGTKTPNVASSDVVKDGKRMHLTAYCIDGSNYYKLRDIAVMFDFGVDWDGTINAITISTADTYKAPAEQPKTLKFTPLDNKELIKENDKLIERAKNDPSFAGYGYQNFFGALAVWDSEVGRYFYQNGPRFLNSAWYESEGDMWADFDSIEFTKTSDGNLKIVQIGTYQRFIYYDLDPERGQITLEWVEKGTVDGLPYFGVSVEYESNSGEYNSWQNPVVFRVGDELEDLKNYDWNKKPKGELLDFLINNYWNNNAVTIGTQAQYRFFRDGKYRKYYGYYYEDNSYENSVEGIYVLDNDMLIFQNGTEMKFDSNENTFVSTTIGFWMVDDDYYRLYPSKNR